MSDGIVRICNQHELELRAIGSDLVCPHGHSCPVDWRVREPLPFVSDRFKPVCPIHGHRLSGAGRILECPEGHQCTTVRPAPVTSMEKPMPRPKTAHARVEKPHGTPSRYWQGCKCQPCKTAINEYVKERKAGKLAPASSTRRKPAALARRPRTVDVVVVPATKAADLEGRVLALRIDLAAAERAYLDHVARMIPGVRITREAAAE